MEEKRVDEVDHEDLNFIISTVEKHWSKEELLGKIGYFSLARVVKKLGMKPMELRKWRLKKSQGEMFAEAGLRKVFRHYYCWMPRFALFYRRTFEQSVKPQAVDGEWSGNTLLAQAGVFDLQEVSYKLPVSGQSLRAYWRGQAKEKGEEAAFRETGIFRRQGSNTYLIDMAIFAAFIKRWWKR